MNLETGFLLSLVNTLEDGVLAVDAQRRVVWANVAMEAFINRPSSEAVGRPFWEVLRHHRLGENVDRALQETVPSREEMEWGPNGIWEVSVRPLASTGRPGGAALIFRNVTERKRLDMARRQFVADVSHELKTPLTALRATLETLLDGALDEAAHARDFLATALDQSERMQRLINDLLTLSRLDAPVETSVAPRSDLGKSLRQVVDALSPLAQQTKVDLIVHGPSETLWVAATEDETSQIIMNLIDNAIKFNLPGGTATVDVWPQTGRVGIRVEDTGMGIDPADLPRVFERFFRADRARGAGGTGLGLAIVKQLVERRGGTVDVISQTGGTQITVLLPSATRNSAQP